MPQMDSSFKITGKRALKDAVDCGLRIAFENREVQVSSMSFWKEAKAAYVSWKNAEGRTFGQNVPFTSLRVI
jgi:hypothetical protein